jgi:hypothetical protein
VLGEVTVGIGHHKAAFSTTLSRVLITNIADCENVMSVYDFGDLGSVHSVGTLTAAAAGWDGSSFPRTCDATYQKGVPPAPHGCATSTVSKKAYCNLTGSGEIVVADLDAEVPTWKSIKTAGAGGGYTKASHDGRHIFTLQTEPREGAAMKPGAPCQIGQLAVIDLDDHTGRIVGHIPTLGVSGGY